MGKEVQSESTLGGDDENDEEKMPTPKGLEDHTSRLYTRISDHGALGVGELGLEASGRDPVDQAKAISRYNALFSQSLNIQVPCNTNLKIGDIIHLEFPRLEGGGATKIDKSMSGNYLISRLNHHIQPNASFSSLNLIRDAHGYSTAYPVDISQGGDDANLAQPFPVQLESGQYTTTGSYSVLPLGGV